MNKFHRVWLVLFLTPLVALFTSYTTFAQSIDVSASVSAPLATSPAVITTPTDQNHLLLMTTTAGGTCPTNGAYVVIQRRAARIGTTSCDNGQFTLPVSLVGGINELNAQVYNATDDPGPNSETVVVYYDETFPPEPDISTTDIPSPIPLNPFQAPFTSKMGTACTPSALRLSHAPYSPINHKEKAWQWAIAVAGGCPPYKLTIVWGDGTSETQTISEETTLSPTHTYTKAGSFKPLFTFIDSANTEATLQLLAVVNADSTAKEETAPPPAADSTPLYEILAYAAGAVITVAVGAVALQAIRLRIKKP